MRVTSAATSLPGRGAAALLGDITELRLGTEPDFVLLYCNGGHRPADLADALAQRWPRTFIQAGTSCRAVITEEGILGGDEPAAALWAAVAEPGSFGVGAAPIEEAPRRAAAGALHQALRRAGREGETPDLIWLAAAPGHEEELLRGLAEAVGPSVRVFGGSTADDHLQGLWQQAVAWGENREVLVDGVTVTVFFSSEPISCAFRNGYEPTTTSWIVTRTEGRVILELDGSPAARVYGEALGGLVPPDVIVDGGNILSIGTMNPFGRCLGRHGALEYYLLCHPEAVVGGSGLRCFSTLQSGDELFLMHGSKENLIKRPERVVHTALQAEDLAAEEIAGALVVICGGCLLEIWQERRQIADSLRRRFKGRPFLGIFTFGEQGSYGLGANLHGNLMMSATVFGGAP